ncbi:MAG: heme ABC exporter ATP-binding protein CcmA [Hyphomonadaceae bacterium]|nr:heme ABC exporter ATP-binding protein CcmA [Hyphomonadaceae bacterium]
MGAGHAFSESIAVRVEGLTLARGERLLIEALSFEARPGAFGEIRGGNGSGKTTLLRALAGFVRPRAGRIAFDGALEPALALHYVGHLNALKGAATVAEHIRYWAGLFGSAADAAQVVERVGLTRQEELPARVLSQGQARRLALARLLIAPRPVWLLDEPAAGLDTQGREVLATAIEAHCAAGGVTLAAVHEPLGPAPTFSLRLGA